MAIGLGVSGLGTIGMIAVAARALSPHEYAAFAVWWTVATLLANVFGVFEAYLTRLVITDIARSRDARRVTALLTGRALVAWALITTLLLATAPLLASELFADTLGAVLLLPLFLLLMAAQSVQRGFANGHRNFTAVSAQLSCDGVLRVGLVVAVAALGEASLTAFAICACAAAAGGLALGSRLAPGWLTRPRLRGAGVATSPIVYLLIGSSGPLLANNGSVPWLASISSVDAHTLGAFAAAVTLSRIPTQFVAAIFAPLLSHLGHAVETGDRVTFDHLRHRADLSASVIGIAYVVAFAALGPWVLSVFVGPDYQLEVPYLVVLAAASSVMFVAVVQQACLAAVDQWRRIAAAWVFGTISFFIVLTLPVEPLWRAAAAPLAGVLTALIALLVLSRQIWDLRSDQHVEGGGSATSTPVI
jgi:O-antigen/teichoic acid export membrane protein